jgi:hypothetical protein
MPRTCPPCLGRGRPFKISKPGVHARCVMCAGTGKIPTEEERLARLRPKEETQNQEEQERLDVRICAHCDYRPDGSNLAEFCSNCGGRFILLTAEQYRQKQEKDRRRQEEQRKLEEIRAKNYRKCPHCGLGSSDWGWRINANDERSTEHYCHQCRATIYL